MIRDRLFTLAALAGALGACATTTDGGDDPAAVASALELDNGGLDMADEAPEADDTGLLAHVDLDADDLTVTDAMERHALVRELLERRDIEATHVFVAWGQLPRDRGNEVPRDWTGAFESDRGALIVRRVARFEDRTDHLLPRTSPDVVPFTSRTRPAADGLLLVVLDPSPELGPLTLRYTAGADPAARAVMAETTLDALVEGPKELVVDDAGNRMVAAARRGRPDDCAHGFFGGRWRPLRDELGVIRGRVVGADGAVLGRVRGLYGERRSGERVFFMKYLGASGAFEGILVGTYGDGAFDGRWRTRDGERGVAGGRYRAGRIEPDAGGHFLGRFFERSCGE